MARGVHQTVFVSSSFIVSSVRAAGALPVDASSSPGGLEDRLFFFFMFRLEDDQFYVSDIEWSLFATGSANTVRGLVRDGRCSD